MMLLIECVFYATMRLVREGIRETENLLEKGQDGKETRNKNKKEKGRRRRKLAACLGKDSKLQSGRAHWKSAAEASDSKTALGGIPCYSTPLSGLVREGEKETNLV
ncbi:hypothetical protein H0G86_005348 [Trichoderma simmonsii]|uniref:Uncharacterized protein n=1 Tax=Trichoderma simmonsii TaxID=1491479 RepID=A0A8G0L9D3_9HYPO|nr:hypothetical protein H0G86_005348 [Trichoderma simmonsii]